MWGEAEEATDAEAVIEYLEEEAEQAIVVSDVVGDYLKGQIQRPAPVSHREQAPCQG